MHLSKPIRFPKRFLTRTVLTGALLLASGAQEVFPWGGHPQQTAEIFERLPAQILTNLAPADINWAINTGSLYPDSFATIGSNFEPIRTNAAAAFLAHGLRNLRYDIHTDLGRAVAFLQIVEALREDDFPRAAGWIAAYAHSMGDMAAANHDPALHVASYDWSEVRLPDGRIAQSVVRPMVELPWLVSTPAGQTAIDVAVESMLLEDDGASPEEALARIMLYGHEGGAYLATHGADILDAALAAQTDTNELARVRQLMAELDAWGVVRALRDVDIAIRLAATNEPDMVSAETQALHQQWIETHMTEWALDAHAIYRDILRDDPAPIGIVLEPTWRMEEGMLGFTAYINAAICRTLAQQGRDYRTLNLREVISGGLPNPAEMPVLIVTAPRIYNYQTLNRETFYTQLSAYITAGGRVLWLFGTAAPPTLVRDELKGLTPVAAGTSWPPAMLEPGTTHLQVGPQSWPLARTPATPAGWHKPASPFVYPAPTSETARVLATLVDGDGEESLIAIADGQVITAPVYAFHPLLIGDTNTLRASSRPLLDPAGEALLNAALSTMGLSDPGFPYPTLDAAYVAAGFDPNAEGAAVFVATADVHYGLNDGTGVLPMVNTMNAMTPMPDFFTIIGDMITHASPGHGVIPTAGDRLLAVQEYQDLKAHLDVLNPLIPVHLAMGNHDQAPGRSEPTEFRSVFPDHPLHHAFDVEGVHIIKLNSWTDAYLDEDQQAWLNTEVASLPSNKTVVVLVHQPALGSLVMERGVGIAVAEAFAEHTGPVWLIAGHHHLNRTVVYQLPHTTVVQATIATGGVGIWGSAEAPGYWVYCLQDGEVFARIYRKLNAGYRIDPEPNYSTAAPLPLPWQGVQDVRWTLSIGQGEQTNYVSHTGGRLNTTWWYNVQEVTYRLPRAAVSEGVNRVAVLAGIPTSVLASQQFYLSSGGTNWTHIEQVRRDHSAHYLLDIPPALMQEEIYVRIVNPTIQVVTLGGFGLLESYIPDPHPSAPPSEGLLAWFSADAGTFTTATGAIETGDGGSVGRWEDRTGHGYHLRRTSGTTTPTLQTTNGPMGNPALYFDGNDYLMLSGDGTSATFQYFTNGTTIGTAFIVFKPEDPVTTNTPPMALTSFSPNYTAASITLGTQTSLIDDEIIVARKRQWTGTSWQNTATGVSDDGGARSISNTNYTLLCVAHNGSSFDFFLGAGAESSTDLQNMATPDPYAPYNDPQLQLTLQVGSSSGSAAPLRGHIAEILLYATALNTEERVAVEGYLTGKYHEPVIHSLTLTIDSSGGVTAPPAGSLEYIDGAWAQIEATPDLYRTFSHWSGDVTSSATNNPLLVLMDRDRAIAAHFGLARTTQNVPHQWLADYGLLPEPDQTWDQLAALDSDNNGFFNWEEFIADTNPTNAASFLAIGAVRPVDGDVTLQWAGMAGRSYTVLRRDDLLTGDWELASGVIICEENGPLYFSEPGIEHPRFYRIGVRRTEQPE